MCGLLGCANRPEAFEFVKKGLKNLDYRGYDSHGWALEDDGVYSVHRGLGPFRGWEGTQPPGNYAIAHVRWATNGEVSEANAHPVAGGRPNMATCWVVHNGVIDNYAEMRGRLELAGYVFETGTDTEVIAHLFDQYGNSKAMFCQILWEMSKILQGQFAFAVLSSRHPNRVGLVSCGAPLLVTPHGFFASDVGVLEGWANHHFRLPDGWTAEYSRNDLFVFDQDGCVRLWDELDWQGVAGKREKEEEGDGAWMAREIHEQEEILRADFPVALPLDYDHVTLLGCGSSYHAALIGRQYLLQAGIDARVEYAVEVPDLPVPDGHHWVALTQSGETRDTLEALRFLKAKRKFTTLVTAQPSSTATTLADEVLVMPCGTERGVAATKSFTASLVALYELSRAWSFKEGLREDLSFESVFEAEPEIIGWAAVIAEAYKHVLFLGRGSLYPVAKEGALKLKEVAYIHAEAIHSSEVKHGPLALIDEDTLCVFLMGSNNENVIRNVEQVRARGGCVLIFAEEGLTLPWGRVIGNPDLSVILLPQSPPWARPIVFTVALQLLAFHAARELGRDVDRPRNISKSCTVL